MVHCLFCSIIQITYFHKVDFAQRSGSVNSPTIGCVWWSERHVQNVHNARIRLIGLLEEFLLDLNWLFSCRCSPIIQLDLNNRITKASNIIFLPADSSHAGLFVVGNNSCCFGCCCTLRNLRVRCLCYLIF